MHLPLVFVCSLSIQADESTIFDSLFTILIETASGSVLIPKDLRHTHVEGLLFYLKLNTKIDSLLRAMTFPRKCPT